MFNFKSLVNFIVTIFLVAAYILGNLLLLSILAVAVSNGSISWVLVSFNLLVIAITIYILSRFIKSSYDLEKKIVVATYFLGTLLLLLITMLTISKVSISWVLVFLNLLPGLFAIVTVFYLPSRFIESLYDLENTIEGFKFLIRSEFGRPQFKPLVIVGEGRIFGGDDAVKKIGGPGGLLVFNAGNTQWEQ